MHNAKSRHQPYVSSTAASWACQLCCEIKRGRGSPAVIIAVWPLLHVDVHVGSALQSQDTPCNRSKHKQGMNQQQWQACSVSSQLANTTSMCILAND
jgi:hypothetical protein